MKVTSFRRPEVTGAGRWWCREQTVADRRSHGKACGKRFPGCGHEGSVSRTGECGVDRASCRNPCTPAPGRMPINLRRRDTVSRMDRPPRTRPPATLASLAAELGISRTTVSNAYNRPDQLSPQLRSRVMEAARQMGYPGPDPMARSLRTRKAGQVGLLLVPARPGSEDVAGVTRAAVDGFVVYSMPDDDPHLTAALARPVPSVICDQPSFPGTDSVGIDDGAAIRQVAEHLLQLGHRRLGVICMRLGRADLDGPVPIERQVAARYHVQRNRLIGLREACTAAGVAWDRIPVVERFEHTVEAGASAAAE